MLKRFLCIFISLSIVFSVCVVSVSADDYSGVIGVTQNDVEYFKKALDLCKRLVKGEISSEDAYSEFVSNATDLVSDNVKDILHVDDPSGLSPRSLANEIVKGVRDKLIELGGDVNLSENEKPLLDMKGYGACVRYDKVIDKYGNSPISYQYTAYVYCDYIIYESQTNAINLVFKGDNNIKVSCSGVSSKQTSINSVVHSGDFTLFGDIRYKDDTPADDVTSPITEKEQTTDPSGLTDTELLDLIEDMLERLILDLPDLSTVEGLLSSILSQLGKLDSDNDAEGLADIKNAIENLAGQEQKDYTSILDEIKSAINNLLNKEQLDYTSSLDEIKNILSEREYNTLLNEINAAIISLGKDNHSDNQEIINVLNDLKNSLNNDASSTDIAPILLSLEKMQKSLDYLCTINTLDFGEDVLDDLTEEESKFLNEYAILISTLAPKFGLVAVNNMLTSLDAVILNTNAPSDLVVNLYGQDITFLSASMFSDESIKYIDIAKIFVSVLLVYSFCLMFRRKVGGD